MDPSVFIAVVCEASTVDDGFVVDPSTVDEGIAVDPSVFSPVVWLAVNI